MTMHYYTPSEDYGSLVYAVDFVQGTWSIVGGDPDSDPVRGDLVDDGIAFLGPEFEEIGIKSITGRGDTFQMTFKPTEQIPN